MKRRIFQFGLILIPVVILMLTEGFLRLTGLGPDTRLFIPINTSTELWGANPNVVLRYFPRTGLSGFGAENLFYQPKPAGVYRIIALGGSTTAGFPYYFNGSFPARLRQYLAAADTTQTYEMINLGMSAVNSTTIRDIIDECLAIEPDLIILYAGHNEFYGAFGRAAEQGLLRLPGMKRMLLFLEKSRLYQTIRRLVYSLRPARDHETLMAIMAQGQVFPPGDRSRRDTLDEFEENMAHVLSVTGENDVPLILCTVASNLRNQRPLHSLPELRLAGYTADELYLAGQNALIAGQDSIARDYFTLARDMDAMPFRAPSAINRIIRQLAGRYAISLADVAAEFEAYARYGIPGDPLFLEHVHPTPVGTDLIVQTIWNTMQRDTMYFGLSRPFQVKNDHPPSRLTALDSVIARMQLDILTSNPPFTSAAGKSLASITPTNQIEKIAWDILAGEKDFKSGHLALAAYYQSQSLHEQAVRECLALVAALPLDKAVHRALASAGMTGKNPALVRKATNAILALDSLDAFANKWGGIYALQNRQEEKALRLLKRAKRLRDDDQIRYNLSGAYVAQNKLEAAAAELDTLLQRNPDYSQARSFRAFLRTQMSFQQ